MIPDVLRAAAVQPMHTVCLMTSLHIPTDRLVMISCGPGLPPIVGCPPKPNTLQVVGTL